MLRVKTVWYEVFFVTLYCRMNVSVRLLVGRHYTGILITAENSFPIAQIFTSVYIVVLLMTFFMFLKNLLKYTLRTR